MTDTTTPPLLATRDALAEALGVQWLVFRKHQPVGAYLPVGQLDGDCRECGGSWPCAPVLDVILAAALTEDPS